MIDQLSSSAPSAAPSTFGGLSVAAHPLGTELPSLEVPDGEKPPALRDKWQGRTETRVKAINKTLAPFDHRVTFVLDQNVGHPQYTVYRGDTVVASEIDAIRSPSINGKGDDFLMLVVGQGEQVLRRGKAEPWDSGLHGYMGPVFAGDRIVSVADESGPGRGLGEAYRYSVMSGDEKLFSDQLDWARTDLPIKGLSAWDGHWVLEVGGRVIIDGKDLGAAKGYTEVFGWQLLAGKPFYYAVKDGKTSVVYGDQVFPTQYESVVHYRCCSPAMYNNGGNEQMAWFFGRKDGQWSYVEIGKYD